MYQVINQLTSNYSKPTSNLKIIKLQNFICHTLQYKNIRVLLPIINYQIGQLSSLISHSYHDNQFYQRMISSSLEKSLQMLKGVEARLSNALTIQQKNVNQVLIEIKDVKLKPKDQSIYQHSGRSQAISNKMTHNQHSARLKTYESQTKSTTVQQLKSQNKQLKKYIHLLQKINQNLRLQLRKSIRKSQFSYSVPKDVSIFYQSDQLSMIQNELQCLRKVNTAQSFQLKHLKQKEQMRLSEPQIDIYKYLSPQKVSQERDKLRYKSSAPIPEYNSACSDCHNHFASVSKFKLEGNHPKGRSKTEYGERTVMKNAKIGTIVKKKTKR